MNLLDNDRLLLSSSESRLRDRSALSSTVPLPVRVPALNPVRRPSTSVTFIDTSIATTIAANKAAAEGIGADKAYVRGSREGLQKMKPINYKKVESSLLDAIRQSKLNQVSTESMLDDWRAKSKFH